MTDLKSEISKSQIGPPVQFAISDFGFEMQESSDFEIPPHPCWVSQVMLMPSARRGM